MKRNILILMFVLFTLAFSGTGCKRTVPVQSFGNANLAAYGSTSAMQVRDAIVRGGSNIGWQMSEERPGLIVAVWRARAHVVTVEIAYSASSYAIKYRSSENMLAEGGQIHRNYNRWVDRLQRNIDAELAKSKK